MTFVHAKSEFAVDTTAANKATDCLDQRKELQKLQAKILDLKSSSDVSINADGKDVNLKDLSMIELQQLHDKLAAELVIKQGLQKLNKDLRAFMDGKANSIGSDTLTKSFDHLNKAMAEVKNGADILPKAKIMNTMLDALEGIDPDQIISDTGDINPPELRNSNQIGVLKTYLSRSCKSGPNTNSNYCKYMVDGNSEPKNAETQQMVDSFLTAFHKAHIATGSFGDMRTMWNRALRKDVNVYKDFLNQDLPQSILENDELMEEWDQAEGIVGQFESLKKECMRDYIVFSDNQSCVDKFFKSNSSFTKKVEGLLSWKDKVSDSLVIQPETYVDFDKIKKEYEKAKKSGLEKELKKAKDNFAGKKQKLIQNMLTQYKLNMHKANYRNSFHPLMGNKKEGLEEFDEKMIVEGPKKLLQNMFGPNCGDACNIFGSEDETNMMKFFDMLQANNGEKAKELDENVDKTKASLLAINEAINKIKKSDDYKSNERFKGYLSNKVKISCQNSKDKVEEIRIKNCTPGGISPVETFLKIGGQIVAMNQLNSENENLNDLLDFCRKQYEIDPQKYKSQYSSYCKSVSYDIKSRRHEAAREQVRRDIINPDTIHYYDENGKIIADETYTPKKDYHYAVVEVAKTVANMAPFALVTVPQMNWSRELATQNGNYWIVPPVNQNPWAFPMSNNAYGGLMWGGNQGTGYFADPSLYSRSYLENTNISYGQTGFDFS